ncbi:MAG: type IV pili methyl-accepting chemotaxis transducer N-terminal domain-containing protein [Burkholderiales bacterium]|nr:type IV pili methyl-accepting chemotaxis transducer N-terminal domain-containing protein [Burkholderiales bacterium]
MQRRQLLQYAGAACIALPLAAQAAPSFAAALNLAGRQRMLAQRLAKAWVMRGLRIAPPRAETVLAESLASQQAQLAELRNYTPSEGVRAAHAELERGWATYRTALAASSNLAAAQDVYDLSEQMQERAHRLTLAYEMGSRSPAADRLINIAGRQRMLSQRLAKFYLFGLWGVNAVAARMEVNFSRAEFSSGMSQLGGAANTLDEQRAAIEALDRAWVSYRALFVGEGFVKVAAEKVVEGSEQILPLTERVVALFERSAATR